MSIWSSHGTDAFFKSTNEAHGTTKDRIVFLASRQVIYQCLLQAAQRHFAAFEVSLIDHLSSSDTFDGNVRLVLLAHVPGRASIDAINECRRRFPTTAIGLVVDDRADGVDQSVFAQRLVQGVLPLSLPLDVWLAVTSLLVAGGEYLSPESVDLRAEDIRANAPVLVNASASRQPSNEQPQHHYAGRILHGVDQATVLGIEALTARERQILKLVSEGCQNKLIAHRMGLSEHTVKAHVHNLIAKLRVTNRTQAAAAFLHEHDPDQPTLQPAGAYDRNLVLPRH